MLMNVTRTETTKRRGMSWTITTVVERTPATLSEARMERARWFDYVGDHVTACYMVKTTTSNDLSAPWVDTFFEIVTPFGVGVVLKYQGGSDIVGFITTDGKVLSTGCWKKRGAWVGHAVPWFRAHGVNINSRKVDHTCPAKIYRLASGKPW